MALDFVDACYCVNLDRATDRWDSFCDRVPLDWPFPPIQRVTAIDGQFASPPRDWKSGPGHWGCYRSHLNTIEMAINNQQRSILILEDDAIFCKNFSSHVAEFIDALPNDWGLVYLGGCHMRTIRRPPLMINPLVYRPFDVNLFHAVAIRGNTLMDVYRFLCTLDWKRGNAIDNQMRRFQSTVTSGFYCPSQWLIGQATGNSTITPKFRSSTFWTAAETIAVQSPPPEPFVAVLGLPFSGTAAIAAFLDRIGLYFGDSYQRFHELDTTNDAAYEALRLKQLDRMILSGRSKELAESISQHVCDWVNRRRRFAASKGQTAAAKHAVLALFGTSLLATCGDSLRVICCRRPINECMEQISPSRPEFDSQSSSDYFHTIEKQQSLFLNRLPIHQKLLIDWENLEGSPHEEAVRVLDFLSLDTETDQMIRAVSWLKRCFLKEK